MKRQWYQLILLLLIVLIGIACASMRPILLSSSEWMEGKDYPVTIRFKGAKPELLTNVIVHYQLGNTDVVNDAMTQMGDEYRFVIPHKTIKPGELAYYISYSYKDEEANTVTQKVKILSFAQAKRKYEEELLSRIIFTPPKEVPMVEDLPLPFSIKAARVSTSVTLYITPDVHPSYQEQTITGQNGIYNINIQKSLLEAGYNTYYFKITENHEDFGELEIFYPPNGENSPLSFTLLNTNELLIRMTRELAQAVEYHAPREVYIEKDWPVELILNYPPDSFLAHFTDHRVRATLCYKQPRASAFRKTEMAVSRNSQDLLTFSSLLTMFYLKGGYNQYYFKIIDNTRAGEVVVVYPPQGEKSPLTFTRLTLAELYGRKSMDLYSRISHIPPATPVNPLTDLNLTLTIKGTAPETAIFFYYRNPSQLQYSAKTMRRNKDVFNVTLTASELQAGNNQYYFAIQEKDEDTGYLNVNYRQEKDEIIPFTFTISKLEDAINKSIQFTPPDDPEEGKPVKVRIFFQNFPDSGKVVLKYRIAGDMPAYLSTDMIRQGNYFDSEIAQAFLKAGKKFEYYFEIQLPEEKVFLKYPDDNTFPLVFNVQATGKKEAGDGGKNRINP